MESSAFSERLMEFGLTRQEAGIYECLLEEGKITGYEAAKILGISRSNAYNSLASMTEKGASYLADEGTCPWKISAKIISAGWRRQNSGFRRMGLQRNVMWKGT